MQAIVIDEPYRFVPPYKSEVWCAGFRHYVPWTVRRHLGVHHIEWRGIEHLRASHAAGHGILLAPNHCRPCDPLVVGMISLQTGVPTYSLASWHLFRQGRLRAFLLRRAGAFSIYREGMDREALQASIDILAEGRRPLTVFPEGVVSRANDRLGELQDGLAFITRAAAKKRAEQGGKVVVHPVALRYWFRGDLAGSVEPVLRSLELRLNWQQRAHQPLRERIFRLGEGLLALKETEYLGRAQPGECAERIARLVEAMLAPVEREWGLPAGFPGVVERVKRLRGAILPDLVARRTTPEERDRRWRQLTDVYYAQQLSFYPPGYLDGEPSVERVLETIERMEEDTTDTATVHKPLHAVIEVGEAIEVSAEKGKRGEREPLMQKLQEWLDSTLARLARESTAPSPFAR